jgi:hypothetical protein
MTNFLHGFLLIASFSLPLFSPLSGAEPTVPVPLPQPNANEGEPAPDSTYVGILKQFEALNAITLKKIKELAEASPSSPLTLDVTPITAYLNKAQANAQIVAENPENDDLVSFTYTDTLMKVALARSAHSRLILSMRAPLEPDTAHRVMSITSLLDSLYELLISAKNKE